MRSLDRPIFMDGRPHPPAWAPHTWTGFSTGEWVGNTLKITATHFKDGYLKRGGPHILLSGMKKQLGAYDAFVMTLVFERAGKVEVEVQVEEAVIVEPAKH